MNTMVLPTSWCSRMTSFCMSRRIIGSSAEKGSSKKSTSGLPAKRPGEADTLLHPARELVGVGVLVAGEADQFDDLQGPLAAFGPAHAADLQAEGHVVDDPAVRQQPEVLEDHGELAAPQVAQPSGVGFADVLALEDDLTGGGFDQPGQTSHQRGLARAGQAHDDEHLALADVEVHIAYGGGAAGTVHEFAAGEAAQLLRVRHLVGLGPEHLPQPHARI